MRPLSLVQGTKLTGNSLFPSHISNDRPAWRDSDAANINTVLLADWRRSNRLPSKWSIYSWGCISFSSQERSLEESIYNRTCKWFFLKFFLSTYRNFSALFSIHHSLTEKIKILREIMWLWYYKVHHRAIWKKDHVFQRMLPPRHERQACPRQAGEWTRRRAQQFNINLPGRTD